MAIEGEEEADSVARAAKTGLDLVVPVYVQTADINLSIRQVSHVMNAPVRNVGQRW